MKQDIIKNNRGRDKDTTEAIITQGAKKENYLWNYEKSGQSCREYNDK